MACGRGGVARVAGLAHVALGRPAAPAMHAAGRTRRTREVRLEAQVSVAVALGGACKEE